MPNDESLVVWVSLGLMNGLLLNMVLHLMVLSYKKTGALAYTIMISVLVMRALLGTQGGFYRTSVRYLNINNYLNINQQYLFFF